MKYSITATDSANLNSWDLNSDDDIWAVCLEEYDKLTRDYRDNDIFEIIDGNITETYHLPRGIHDEPKEVKMYCNIKRKSETRNNYLHRFISVEVQIAS